MFDSFFDELTKLAREEGTKEKAMRGAVKARPWVQRFATSAIPAAVAANFLLPFGGTAGKEALKRKLVAGAGLLGGAAGVGDLAIKRWAAKNPRKSLAQEIKKEGAAGLFLKVAAMAADLREKGIGGVERPPMVTEDSKQFAYNKLETSSKPGEFLNSTKPRHLRAPGPSIQQVATTPTR
jgi:hypothetical protein